MSFENNLPNGYRWLRAVACAGCAFTLPMMVLLNIACVVAGFDCRFPWYVWSVLSGFSTFGLVMLCRCPRLA